MFDWKKNMEDLAKVLTVLLIVLLVAAVKATSGDVLLLIGSVILSLAILVSVTYFWLRRRARLKNQTKTER